METLIKLRGSYRGCFTKFIGKLETFLKTKADDSDLYVSHLSQLTEKYMKIQNLDNDILNLIKADVECTEESICDEIESAESYEEKFIYFKTKLERCIKRSVKDIDTYSVSEKRNFKLPKIELQKFDGALKDWLSFWGLFKKIDLDPDISNEDKYQYLIQSTLKGSRAREVVESFPPTAENYVQAIECLKARFGRDDVLVEVYVRELLSLVLNNALNNEHKLPLIKLYDRIETQLRSLQMLGVTSDKYASMLYPLVESCLPTELLRIWERHLSSLTVKPNEKFNKLETLMKFLGSEIEGEEKINLARSGFGLEHKNKRNQPMKPSFSRNKNITTGMELYNSVQSNTAPKNSQCVFCDKNHSSTNCRYAQGLPTEQRKNILIKKGGCFRCLKINHISSTCRSRIKCSNCGRFHHFLICNSDQTQSPKEITKPKKPDNDVTGQDETLANVSSTPYVLLQTLVVHLRGEKGKVKIRALIDSASQRSYILKSTAQRLNYQPHRRESLRHSLFGGASTEVCHHDVYRAFLTDYDLTYNCNFEVLGQETICATIPPVADGTWMKELSENNIHLSDQRHGPIELLIGADVAGKLLTGGYKLLPSGLVAIETKLGWTAMGRTRERGDGNTDLIVISMLAREISETDLWNLDVIGIKDQAEKQSRREAEEAARQHFLTTLTRLPDGRYEVSLPWLEGMQPPVNNRMIAERRLKGTIKNLQSQNLVESYEDVFHEWLKEEIIEPVDIARFDDLLCTYLPHRAVIKENSTTKIRPVFDASAKPRNGSSLNSCLEKGPNLVELIPSILNRFRLGAFGIIADIKKAFLQISIDDKDRDYLRFLWFENGDPDKFKIYRHKRVVFGINASPFLLGATISYHLDNVPEHLQEVAKKLKTSMYVDNCVTSLDTMEEVETFIEQSRFIMLSAKFDLRGWRFNEAKSTLHGAGEESPALEENVSVLGLEWNTKDDTLRCSYKRDVFDGIPLTKRSILSSANQLFDPLGMLSPVTLRFKILMQDCWRAKLSWDAKLSDELAKKFLKLKRDLTYVDKLTIPRRLVTNFKERNNLSFHVSCDASQLAYATCIFLRNENEGVSCQLVQSRSRVAPLKPVTVSRLELLACTIGIRLMNAIKQDLHMEDVTTFYWTDSMNALHWIKNEEEWGVFVMNRVKEIRSYSSKSEWNHVPGTFNPADLPSRGCSVVTLLSQKWHDGPSWLKQDQKYWPVSEAMVDKEIINSEKKKTIVTLTVTKNDEFDYLTNISSFEKIIRITAWILRFIRNCKKQTPCTSHHLEIEELTEAETVMWKMIQKTSFRTVNEGRIRNLRPFVDPTGLIRIKTQLLMRKDFENFKYPILLPSDHIVVHKMIRHKHETLSHCGIQTLMSSLREEYWLIRSRRTIRRVLKACTICKRFEARHPEVQAAPLPADRLRDSATFETTGIDLAGPLFLKDRSKAWIVLFTCAVYRTVHLELVTSLTTDKFLLSLRRFIARRGRPSIIYTDNGSNFNGSNQALNRVDWQKIKGDTSVSRIRWKFIPPSSPWWGGFWERLIGLLKTILRKVLGKASLRYEELSTILCDCEDVINSRPLTYVSEDLELEPLTPAMFLRDLKESGIPDLDQIDSTSLRKRYLYRLKLREDLRKRFRSEYLGQLRSYTRKSRNSYIFSIGDIVLIESTAKRIKWPLGKVVQLIEGKDGIVRLVKVRTKQGDLLRPIQRLYPLEVSSPNDEDLRKQIRSPTICDKGEHQNPSDSSSPVLDSQEDPSPAPQPRRINRYGRTLRAPRRLDL